MALPNYVQGNTLQNPWGTLSSGYGVSGGNLKPSNYKTNAPLFAYDAPGQLEALMPVAKELALSMFGENYGMKRGGGDYGSGLADARLASQGATNVASLLSPLYQTDYSSAQNTYQSNLNKFNAYNQALKLKDDFNLAVWLNNRRNQGHYNQVSNALPQSTPTQSAPIQAEPTQAMPTNMYYNSAPPQSNYNYTDNNAWYQPMPNSGVSDAAYNYYYGGLTNV